MGIVTKIKESLHKDHHKEVATTSAARSMVGNHLLENEKIISVKSTETGRPSIDTTTIHPQQDIHKPSSSVSSSIVSTKEEHDIATTVVKNPAIVKEKHFSEEVIEITPVVERHITQPEIHPIVKHSHEAETIATTESIVNPTITKTSGEEHQIHRDVDGLAHLTSQLVVSAGAHEQENAPATKRQIILEPIVKEIIHHEYIEQTQPVVTKDVYHQHIKHVVQPITEHVLAPAIVHDVNILPSTPVLISFTPEIQDRSPPQLTGELVATDVVEPKSRLM